MNSKMNSKLFFAAALALSTPAFSQAVPTAPPPAATPAAPAVTLRYKFAVGQVHFYTYKMEMNMLMDTGQTGAGVPISMTTQTTMRQTVKSIRPSDGAATITTQILSVRSLRNGQEVPMSEDQQEKAKQSFTQVMLPSGKILSTEAPALSGMDLSKGASGSLGSTVALPQGPTKIGDTWNTTGTIPGMGVDLDSKSTLASLDQKNGATVASIQTQQNGTINKPAAAGLPMTMQGPVTGNISQVFDMSAGVLKSMTGTCSADLLMTAEKSADGTALPGVPSAMKMQMQMKYTMELLTGPPAALPDGSAVAPAQ